MRVAGVGVGQEVEKRGDVTDPDLWLLELSTTVLIRKGLKMKTTNPETPLFGVHIYLDFTGCE